MTTAAETSTARTPGARKAAYGAPAFALALVGIPLYVYIPKFYTDVVGVPIAAVGSILAAARVFDAITDPAMGYLSDRTTTRFGRRRPYILGGSVCLAVSVYALFTPPQLSAGGATAWLGITVFAVFLFWTVTTVPYESLGPEITYDYHERTELFSIRDGLLIAGTLAAAASPGLISGIVGESGDGAAGRETFFVLALLYMPLLVGLCLWCVLAVREIAPAPAPAEIGPRRVLGGVFRNRPFVILLAAYTVAAFGNNLPATLILYYVEYVLRSTYANFFLMIYFVTGVLFLPLWVALSRRWGKRNTWLVSMILNTGAFSGVFFLGAGDEWAYGALVFLSGMGFGATVALPSAMQADVIDYDELLSGERREGRYIGLWAVSKKAAAALGVGSALMVLAWAGYAPNQEQTPETVFTLRALYALVPCVCNAAACAIVLSYPITEPVHARIRRAVELRQRGEAPADPLEEESV